MCAVGLGIGVCVRWSGDWCTLAVGLGTGACVRWVWGLVHVCGGSGDWCVCGRAGDWCTRAVVWGLAQACNESGDRQVVIFPHFPSLIKRLYLFEEFVARLPADHKPLKAVVEKAVEVSEKEGVRRGVGGEEEGVRNADWGGGPKQS